MPKQFFIKGRPNGKVITLNPKTEIELHHNLFPRVKNTLCAKFKRNDNGETINVFKQEVIMKYDESKVPKSSYELESILKEEMTSLKNVEECSKPVKRKLPLPPIVETKSRKIVNSSVQDIINYHTNQFHGGAHFKKPILEKNFQNSITSCSQNNEPNILNNFTPIIAILESQNEMKNKNCMLSSPIINLLETNAEETQQEPSTSSNIAPIIDMLNLSSDEFQQKPSMKCLPFKRVEDIPPAEVDQYAKYLAQSLALYFSKKCSSNALPSTQSNNDLINSIVSNFKTPTVTNKPMTRTNLNDDPIVRDYLQHTQLKTLESKRKCKLPESMTSLPIEVLNLVPDSPREMKYVVDFYHSMATVIVKVLDLYVKKSCKQGRIKSDDDFKYLAKKLNSNILYKELQVKKVEDLRISDSVKQKVEQYIKKYMLKHGKVYKRKIIDQ